MIIMITTSIVMSLVDEKMKLPWIVIEGTGISNTVPVNVTVFPAGITIEQTPDGICPSCHVAASLKSPVSIAVQTEFGITVVSPPVGPPVPAVVDSPPVGPPVPAVVDSPPVGPPVPAVVDSPPVAPPVPAVVDSPPVGPPEPAVVVSPPVGPPVPAVVDSPPVGPPEPAVVVSPPVGPPVPAVVDSPPVAPPVPAVVVSPPVGPPELAVVDSPPVGPPVPAVVAGGNDASENNIKRFQNNARTKFILLTIRCLSNFSVETNKDEVWTTKR